jgi:hypothetical protein
MAATVEPLSGTTVVLRWMVGFAKMMPVFQLAEEQALEEHIQVRSPGFQTWLG